MTTEIVSWLYLILPLIAALYAAVGHGGASSYLAAMTLLGVAPDTVRPVALVLNLLVAGMAFIQYYKVVRFPWPLMMGLLAASIPAAYWGGKLSIDPLLYRQLIGWLLLLPILRLLGLFAPVPHPKPIQYAWVPVIGLALGFLSGLIGIGGGILLSPLLLFLGWTDLKTTAAVSALFIVLNSLSGLIAIQVWKQEAVWHFLPLLLVTLLAGWLGSYWGAQKMTPIWLTRTLTLVLLIAAIKLIGF